MVRGQVRLALDGAHRRLHDRELRTVAPERGHAAQHRAHGLVLARDEVVRPPVPEEARCQLPVIGRRRMSHRGREVDVRARPGQHAVRLPIRLGVGATQDHLALRREQGVPPQDGRVLGAAHGREEELPTSAFLEERRTLRSADERGGTGVHGLGADGPQHEGRERGREHTQHLLDEVVRQRDVRASHGREHRCGARAVVGRSAQGREREAQSDGPAGRELAQPVRVGVVEGRGLRPGERAGLGLVERQLVLTQLAEHTRVPQTPQRQRRVRPARQDQPDIRGQPFDHRRHDLGGTLRAQLVDVVEHEDELRAERSQRVEERGDVRARQPLPESGRRERVQRRRRPRHPA